MFPPPLPFIPLLTKLGDEHGHVAVVLGHRVVSRHCPRLLHLSITRHKLLVRAHEPWRARKRAEHVLQLPEICGVENICATYRNEVGRVQHLVCA